MSPERAPGTTPLGLLLIFSRIGLTSFGGGLSGWLMREFVQDRAWIAEEDFLNGLSLSQALPGVNVTNMAIWFGYRMLGIPGALAALTGIVVPPALVIILMASAFAALSRYPATHAALVGASAAAIGLSLSMGITVARRVPRRAAPLVIAAFTLVAVGVLHWPLIPVVVGGGLVSVAIEYRRLGRRPA